MEKPGENLNMAPREKQEQEQDPLLSELAADFERVSKKYSLSESELKDRSRQAKSSSGTDQERFYRKFRKEETERQRKVVAQELFELKKEYWKKYPDRLQEVELFFGLSELNQIQRDLGRPRNEQDGKNPLDDKKKRIKTFEFLTGWNYLATDTIIKNKDNREYLEQFWSTLERTNDSLDGRGFFSGRKRGLIGQAGVYHLMQELGLSPDLATPSEDALQKTDFHLRHQEETDVRVQAKHSSFADKLILENTDSIHYPAVNVSDKDAVTSYMSKDLEEMMHLRDSCERQSKRLGKKVSGYYIVAPEGSFDPITAEPSPEILEQAREKISNG